GAGGGWQRRGAREGWGSERAGSGGPAPGGSRARRGCTAWIAEHDRTSLISVARSRLNAARGEVKMRAVYRRSAHRAAVEQGADLRLGQAEIGQHLAAAVARLDRWRAGAAGGAGETGRGGRLDH